MATDTPKFEFIIDRDAPILITGAAGFIGSRVVGQLLAMGFRNLTCFVRPSSDCTGLDSMIAANRNTARVAVIKGNLLSQDDCSEAAQRSVVIFHLAAGGSDKSYPDAVMNSVVTTRNLLEAARQHGLLKRFVNVSSLAVYSNMNRGGRALDETCQVESRAELRGDAYSFAKILQDELVADYGRKHGIPYVIARPGYVLGPGKREVPARVGIGTFGVFLHLGGSNRIPVTHVENCAEAIVLAGLVRGVEGEAFNIVDDNLPTSRQFLRWYKRNVRKFHSIYVPRTVSHLLCYLWERYSRWSEEQLPPVFNTRRWHVYWKKTRYSNEKLKKQLGWQPKVTMAEGFQRYFESCRVGGADA